MTIPLSLALQGGGAHGAFTWGVLDALLEDGRVSIDALSGTSAGAMNAVVLAQGWTAGGADGARAALRAFWSALAATLPMASAQRAGDGRMQLAPAMKLWMLLAHYASPAQMNPFDLNPLREVLEAQIDFERLRRQAGPRLYIAATQADTGRLRVFSNAELTVDTLLASSCLPSMFRAPRIDGQAYWDGAFTANPAVFPLLGPGHPSDVLLVLLAPLQHAPLSPHAPAAAIHARASEIAFSAGFLREMQALAHAPPRRPARWWSPRGWGTAGAPPRFHLIEAQPALAHLAPETRLAVDLRFFETLHAAGRDTLRRWLAEHGASLGRRASVDLARTFG